MHPFHDVRDSPPCVWLYTVLCFHFSCPTHWICLNRSIVYRITSPTICLGVWTSHSCPSCAFIIHLSNLLIVSMYHIGQREFLWAPCTVTRWSFPMCQTVSYIGTVHRTPIVTSYMQAPSWLHVYRILQSRVHGLYVSILSYPWTWTHAWTCPHNAILGQPAGHPHNHYYQYCCTTIIILHNHGSII